LPHSHAAHDASEFCGRAGNATRRRVPRPARRRRGTSVV
jgi:hypothetical protein